MTLKLCELRLELAKKANNTKDIKFWETRIAYRMMRAGKPVQLVKEKPEVKKGGKKPA